MWEGLRFERRRGIDRERLSVDGEGLREGRFEGCGIGGNLRERWLDRRVGISGEGSRFQGGCVG